MAGALRKTMVYLGLSDSDPQDEYEAYEDDYVDDYAPPAEAPAPVTHLRPAPKRPVASAPVAAELRRITTVHPRSYNDARVIGEAFRAGTPVIMNLSEMTDADAKRLVDFSAGLIFGLHGAIERVTSKVFLLSPEHIEVSGEESAVAAPAPGFYNQS